MISALLLSSLAGATPELGAAITEARRAFIEDGDARVSATPTHRVISHADGSLELQGAQPLRLSLQSVRREGTAPCRAAALSRSVDAASPRTVRITRACALTETWTNGPAGLEQTFTLERPPPGTGALTLFLAVSGPWHHHDSEGQVFRGPGAAQALRYGNAFVVRGGRKLPIVVTHVEGGLELKVPKALVDAPGAFPMHLDPVLAVEVPLDANATQLGALPTDEQSPAIAVNAMGQALVVWVDNRRQGGTDIFGARLSASGAALDPRGLPIALEPGHQVSPTVCREGNGWLVAWASDQSGGGSEVIVVRVDDQGVPGTPFVIEGGSQPALAAKGTTGSSVIAFIDVNDLVQVSAITGPSITPEGASTAAMGVASTPAIAATDTKWFAAWVSTLGANTPVIRGLTKELGVLVPVQLSDGTAVLPAARPTVAMNQGQIGDQAYIYWEQGGGVVGKRFGAVFFDTIGNASSPALVMNAPPGSPGAQPTLGYFQNAALKLFDLNDGGFTSSAVSLRARQLALAAGGPIYAVWTENVVGGGSDVWSVSVAGGNFLPPFVLTQAGPAQRMPHVAFPTTGDGLAVWLEGDRSIRGGRLQLQNDGTLSVGTSFLIADPIAPVLALDLASSGAGPDFLVTWLMAGGLVQGHLANADGPGTGVAIPFSIGQAATPPAVAWDDSTARWVVAWGTATEVLSRTLVPGAAPSALRSHGAAVASLVDLSCLGGKCLVAWETDGGVQAGLYGAITVGAPGTYDARGGQPAVTHDGADFVLGVRDATGFSFSRVVPSTAAISTFLTMSQPTGSRFSNLSLSPGIPPVLAFVQSDSDGGVALIVDRLGLPGQRASVAHGQLPIVGTTGAQPDARGALVYQRYNPEPNLQSMRGWGAGFAFPAPPDAGVGRDAGVDAGVDAGLDDAGTTPDAGAEAPDAGVMVFGTSGCTCQSVDGAPFGLALLLMLWGTRTRR